MVIDWTCGWDVQLGCAVGMCGWDVWLADGTYWRSSETSAADERIGKRMKDMVLDRLQMGCYS